MSPSGARAMVRDVRSSRSDIAFALGCLMAAVIIASEAGVARALLTLGALALAAGFIVGGLALYDRWMAWRATR